MYVSFFFKKKEERIKGKPTQPLIKGLAPKWATGPKNAQKQSLSQNGGEEN
jgi:hypothetical protein